MWFFRKISLKELFLPILVDLNNVNAETGTAEISANNWHLANDPKLYDEILKEIDRKKELNTAKDEMSVE